MMKIGMMVMMALAFNLGVAHAESVRPTPGFDRVGMASAAQQRNAVTAQLKAAPGEGAESGDANYSERKREMARRLVWLMLSAR
jgi:hypothetical protein